MKLCKNKNECCSSSVSIFCSILLQLDKINPIKTYFLLPLLPMNSVYQHSSHTLFLPSIKNIQWLLSPYFLVFQKKHCFGGAFLMILPKSCLSSFNHSLNHSPKLSCSPFSSDTYNGHVSTKTHYQGCYLLYASFQGLPCFHLVLFDTIPKPSCCLLELVVAS